MKVRAAPLCLGLVLGLVLLASVAPCAGVSVRAFVDQEEIEPGDALVLSIEVSGAARAGAFELGPIEGFASSYLGPSTQISIVQGQVSSTVTHRYRLVARRPGQFLLGPFTVNIGGTSYRTEAVRVSVRKNEGGNAKGSAPRGRARDVFVQLSLGRPSAYLHERVALRITLLAGGVRLEDIEFPALAGDGFSLEPFGQPRRGVRTVDGIRYRTMTFETALVAQRTGRLRIGPATMKMTLLVERRNRDDFFGDLWRFDPFAERRPIELEAEAAWLEVAALPEVGKPADFGGAVGEFDLAVSAKPIAVKVGDPVTVTMKISGRGNLAGVAPPRIEGEDFKSYPVQAAKGQEGGADTIFEQVVIPKSEGVRQIPPVSFSYFDPNRGRYVTVTSSPVALSVSPAEPAGQAEVTQEERGKAGEVIGEDIVFIKDLPGHLVAAGDRIYRRPWFWVFHAIPLLLLAATGAAVRRRERLLGDPGYARYVRAKREARRRLRAAARSVGRRDGAVFEEVGQAVRDYLAAKLDLPPGAVEPERVAERLGGPDQVAARCLKELFALLESVRFGGVAAAVEREKKALELGRSIVKGVEKGRRSRWGLPVLALVAFVVPASTWLPAAGWASAAGDARAAFFAGNELYRRGDYGQAAQRYRRALATGLESAELHFNLGNAYFRSGELGRAIASYERARHLAPRDPDIEANLEFARSKLAIAPATPLDPLWQRLLFPLAFVASADELVLVTSFAYFLLTTLAVVRLLLPRFRPPLVRACATAALLLALAAANASERIWQDEFRPRVVVVVGGPVAVRFEPSEAGTVHFQVGEGTVLLLERREPGWLQVERADGMRGWIGVGAVEVV